MKIIVDAFGGDNAPLEIIKGCAEATSELDIDIMLTGDEKEIRRVAQENQISLNRIEIADAPDVITMEDSAGDIMKSKNNSLCGKFRRSCGGRDDDCQTDQRCQACGVCPRYAQGQGLFYAD